MPPVLSPQRSGQWLLGFPQTLSRGPPSRGCWAVQLDRTGWQYMLSASEQPQAHRTVFPPSFSGRCRCRDTDLECVWIRIKHTNTQTHPFLLFDICSLPSQTALQRLGWCCPPPTPKGWSSVMFLESIARSDCSTGVSGLTPTTFLYILKASLASASSQATGLLYSL